MKISSSRERVLSKDLETACGKKKQKDGKEKTDTKKLLMTIKTRF
jgi:hypothetical protein